jgi:citrate synthase
MVMTVAAEHSSIPPISATIGDQILVRGHDLTELIGHVSFTAAMLLDIDGAMPDAQRVRVVDAILVALMEHGITPSTLAGRLILDGAPESMQGAVAGGLLATGDRFLGTVMQAADAAQRVVQNANGGPLAPAAAAVVDDLLADPGVVPGVGHNLHRDLDPRVQRLLDVTRECDLDGRHREAFLALAAAIGERKGRPLLPNAAGMIGAILSDLGYSPFEARGFALISRCAGLVAHVIDERAHPIAGETWTGVHERVSHAAAPAVKPPSTT